MSFALKDVLLKVLRALPAAASSTVYSAAIDLGAGDKLAAFEVKISAPAVNTTMVPDTKTMTYSIQHGDDAAFGDVADLFPGVLVQTGAGGAGAAAATFTTRMPVGVKRYLRLKIVSGANVTDSSAVSATFELLF